VLRSVTGVCPACQGRLQSERVGPDNAAVSRCELCSGIWFEWFAGEAGNLSHHLVDIVVDTTLRLQVGGPCPNDASELQPQPYLDGGPHVERCPKCLGLFLPAARIEELRRFHERMPNQMEEPIERVSFFERLWHTFAG
jgi:Zn-finger nucleic acid-binding protein